MLVMGVINPKDETSYFVTLITRILAIYFEKSKSNKVIHREGVNECNLEISINIYMLYSIFPCEKLRIINSFNNGQCK